MIDSLPTTGKISRKRYQCSGCGMIKEMDTNHWGETYGPCRAGTCWGKPVVWKCLEAVPDGYGVPEPWKLVKLGDICEIIERKITCK